MPGSNVRGRDDGMRRISRTTRWLAGMGLLVTGGFSVLFAVQAGSSGANPQVSTPTATAPPITTPPVTAAPSTGNRVVPVPVTPAPVPVNPVPRVPIQPHTSSRGS